MANAFKFTSRGSPKVFVDRLQYITDNQEKMVVSFLREVTFHAAERAEVNAPILTGLLRAETRPLGVLGTGRKIISGIASAVPYAFLMHEFQRCLGFPPGELDVRPKPNPTTGSMYGFGPYTQKAARTPEGGPGGKFISRVLNFHANAYLQRLAEKVTLMLQGRTQ